MTNISKHNFKIEKLNILQYKNLCILVARNVTNVNRIEKQRLVVLVAYLMDDFPLGNASK